MLYGDSSLTGRTVIWDFADDEIARNPLVGWGYQSFWLVPDSPAVTDAPGWVKAMPNAHNGYIDTKLEMGYVGLAFLLAFLIATLHAVGRVADRDPTRARLVLSLALFIILYNFFESLWMRAFEFLWVVFVIIAAEIGRYWRPLPWVGRRTDRGAKDRGALTLHQARAGLGCTSGCRDHPPRNLRGLGLQAQRCSRASSHAAPDAPAERQSGA